MYVWKAFLGYTECKRLIISISDLLHLSSGDKKRFSSIICSSTITSSKVKRCTQHYINYLYLLSKPRVDGRDRCHLA